MQELFSMPLAGLEPARIAPLDFEFWGQPRTCYPVVEPTGLFGHLPRS